MSSYEPEDFVGAKFYCPHAFADGSQHIWITEKMLEFSSAVLPAVSPYSNKVVWKLKACVCLLGQVGSGSNAAIAVAASRAIGATLEVIVLVWMPFQSGKSCSNSYTFTVELWR